MQFLPILANGHAQEQTPGITPENAAGQSPQRGGLTTENAEMLAGYASNLECLPLTEYSRRTCRRSCFIQGCGTGDHSSGIRTVLMGGQAAIRCRLRQPAPGVPSQARSHASEYAAKFSSQPRIRRPGHMWQRSVEPLLPGRFSLQYRYTG